MMYKKLKYTKIKKDCIRTKTRFKNRKFLTLNQSSSIKNKGK